MNCFYDTRKDGDKNAAILRGTPGLKLWTTVPSSPIRGWHVVAGVLYVVAGSYLYSYSDSTGFFTNLGTITTSSAGYVSMDDNVNQLGIVDGVGLWVYTLISGAYKQYPTAGNFGQVTTDANTPNGAKTITFLSGYTIVEKPNTLFVYISAPSSATDDMTNWTNVSSLPNYVIKNDSSDPVLAVDSFNGMIVVWGTNSIEYFQNAGTSPNPFARVTGGSQTWGLAAIWSRQIISNSMIFLGQNPQGGTQVMMLQGYAPERVSNSDIENIISSFSTYSDAIAISYMLDGHPMYQLTFPSADRSFLFDASTKAWQEASSGVLKPYGRHLANLSEVYEGFNIVADLTSANIYQFDVNTYTDNGAPIKRMVVTKHINDGGNLMAISEILLDMETGVGLQSGQGSNPQLMMEVSTDGGRTWTQQRWTSIGTIGTYLARANYRRVGFGRDFVFRFTMTDPVKFTIMRGSLAIKPLEGRSGS